MNVARAGALVMAALLVGACSAGDDAAPTTTVRQTLAPTTVPTTTSLPATTAPPVTTATTAAATPTLPPDTEHVKQAVIAAANASYEVYLDAIRNPTDQTKLDRLPEVMGGEKLRYTVQLIADSVASGSYVIENRDTPGIINAFYDSTFVYDASAGTASIEFCRIGSDLRIKPGGNPDGTDQILINEVNAYHERSDLELTDGRWIDVNGAVIQKFEGVTECVAP